MPNYSKLILPHESRSAQGAPSGGRQVSPLLLWGLVIVLLAALKGLWLAPSLNADNIYALMFVDDLFSNNGIFRWNLGPNSYFFPDICIVGLGYLLGLRDAANFVFYSVVYELLFFGTGIFFLKASSTVFGDATPISAMTVVLATFVGLNDVLGSLLAVPVIHGGVLPIIFAVLGFTVKGLASEQAERRNELAVLTLTSLAVFSDLIFLVQLVAPAVVFLTFLSWSGSIRRLSAGRLIGLLVIGGTLGWLARKGINLSIAVRVTEFEPLPSQALSAVTTYYHLFPELIELLGWGRMIVIGFGLAIGLILSVVWARGRLELPSLPAGVTLLTVCAIFSLLGTLLTGQFSELALVRRQMPGYVIPLFILFWTVVASVRVVRPTLLAFLFAGAYLTVGVLFVTMGLAYLEARPLAPFLHEHRGIASELPKIGIDFVLAEYWDTKPLVRLSAGKFDVCAVVPPMTPYPWVTNVGWCYQGFQRWETNRGLLAWVGKRLESGLATALGNPDRVIEAGPTKAFVFSWSKERSKAVRQAVCVSELLNRLPLCGQ
jgi:hypothetical protein